MALISSLAIPTSTTMSHRRKLSHLALSLVLLYHLSYTQSQEQQFFEGLETASMRRAIESTVLTSYTPTGIAYPSTKYTYVGLMESLREMALQGITSHGRTFQFYTSDRLDYGRVNLALFLAMCMTESIVYDTCDEFNTDEIAGRFAISNSCGQNTRSYQNETCTNSEEHMSCPVDTNMVMVSSGYATVMIGRAPPPFSCRPKANPNDYAGYWDTRLGASSKTAYSNARGRSDTEACCWWGRGALLTRGVCNIGKLNYYLGSRFPSTDFCTNPESICAGTEEMRWITAFFEWVERIQDYRDWDYTYNLQQFVQQGMEDDSFIDTVISIFTRGCHSSDCSSLEITMGEERKKHFKAVLDIFGLPNPSTQRPTSSPPTLSPKWTTSQPTSSMTSSQPVPPSPPQNSPNTPSMLTAMGLAQQSAPSMTLSQPVPPGTQQNNPNTKPAMPNENTAMGPAQQMAPPTPVPPCQPQHNPNIKPTMPNENTAMGPTQQEILTAAASLVPTIWRPTRNEPRNKLKTKLITLEDNLAPSLAISWLTRISLTIIICAFWF